MRKLVTITIFSTICWLNATSTQAYTYGQGLCKNAPYYCLKVKKGDSWESLFPDIDKKTIVRKVNRMNTPLHAGMVIAIPKSLEKSVLMDFAPFPHKMAGTGSTLVKINLSDLAWGAYDEAGTLVNWGPVSGGKSYCPDIRKGCRTPPGSYIVQDKQGPGCISHRFPVPGGGAKMPYCMHYHGGYAMHAGVVPGFNASHGCMRMFLEDAKWLNQNFVQVGLTKVWIAP